MSSDSKKTTKADAEGLYANTHTGERGGHVAEAGLGRAHAKWEDFSANASGPSASAEINLDEPCAMARAEIGSASATAGPVSATVGLAVDTGYKISEGTAEVKLLGTGVTVGRTLGVSLFGNELKFKLW